MADTDPCVACATTQAETHSTPGYDGVYQTCPRCGVKISGSTLAIMSGGVGEEKRAKLSGWIRDQNRAGVTPEINSYIYSSVLSRPTPSVADRATRLLIEEAHGQTELGARFQITEPRFLAATYSSNDNDLYFLMRLLEKRDLIEHISAGGVADISLQN